MKKKIDLHSKYQPLFKNNSRYYVVTGGRGSGKSFGVALRLLLLTYEPNEKILFSRFTMTSANVSIIPEFIEKIDLLGAQEHFRITKDEIINLTTGSSIMFKGIKTSSGNQTAALKSLTGLTCFVLDEAEELVDQEVFDKINLSIRSILKHNKVILILNPTTKEHWVYTRFFESQNVDGGFNGVKDDTTYVHSTYKDNKENLDESFLRDVFKMKLERPDKYEHQILGGWLEKADGVIFTNWKVGDFMRLETSCYGQDFGFSEDPTVLCEVSLDRNRRKMYVREVFSGAGLTTNDIAAKNIQHAGSGLIMADSSNPRLVAEIRSRGVNIRGVKKKNGSILAGIALMQDFEIVVDRSGKNIIKELNNYVWHISNEKPIDKYNHFIDAIRYALTKLHVMKKSGNYAMR